jgi:hypothetical protein
MDRWIAYNCGLLVGWIDGPMKKLIIIRVLYKYHNYASRKPRTQLSSVVDKGNLII